MVVTSAPCLQSNNFRFSEQHLDSCLDGVRGCGECVPEPRVLRNGSGERWLGGRHPNRNRCYLLWSFPSRTPSSRPPAFWRCQPERVGAVVFAGLGPAWDGGHLLKRLRHHGRCGAGSIAWVCRTTTRSSPICMAWACITWSCAVILASRAATSFSSLSAALVGDSGTKTCHEPFTFSPANAPAFSLRRIVSGETSNCALAWRMLKPDFCTVPTSVLPVANAILGKLLRGCMYGVMQGLGILLVLVW